MDDSLLGEYSGHFADLNSPQQPDSSPDSCMAQIADILNVVNRTPYRDPREEHKVTVPRLRLKESSAAQMSRRYTESKSTESINSLGTVIRHETPKRPPSASRHRPPSPYLHNRRPSSAKPKRSSGSVKEEIEVISHLTAQDAIRSLYLLVNAKVKSIGEYQLPEKDRADVQNFFQEQKRQFQNELKADLFEKTLVSLRQTQHDMHKLEVARRENERRDKKREEINEKLQVDDIRRKEKSLRLRRDSADAFIKAQVQSLFRKYEQQKRAEESYQRREETQIFKGEKQLILDNIKNFYQDRIKRLRERIEESKFTKQIEDTERKKVSSIYRNCLESRGNGRLSGRGSWQRRIESLSGKASP